MQLVNSQKELQKFNDCKVYLSKHHSYAQVLVEESRAYLLHNIRELAGGTPRYRKMPDEYSYGWCIANESNFENYTLGCLGPILFDSFIGEL